MPIYELKCSKCGHTWEARVYSSDDKATEYICHKCGKTASDDDRQITPVNFTIGPGFAARNGYGLKKFDDGNGKGPK